MRRILGGHSAIDLIDGLWSFNINGEEKFPGLGWDWERDIHGRYTIDDVKVRILSFSFFPEFFFIALDHTITDSPVTISVPSKGLNGDDSPIGQITIPLGTEAGLYIIHSADEPLEPTLSCSIQG
jgi:hypothetical protein